MDNLWTGRAEEIIRDLNYTRSLKKGRCEAMSKRIYRVSTEEGLIVRTKQRRKIARRQRVAAPMAAGANQCWSMDFVSEKLADGRSFRILTVVDQFTRPHSALAMPVRQQT